MVRGRELGIAIGRGRPGPLDAITDVAGVRVGHATIVEGDDVRTGVTIVEPRPGSAYEEPCFAGIHRLNGNGELTGAHWIAESGLLGGPVAITNTHSVGAVHEALVALERERRPDVDDWALPVVAETWDGWLNDIDGFHVRAEHVRSAVAGAAGGPVAEGALGGGTGMVCHGCKGGIGTASRVTDDGWTVGALVQANYGQRELLRVDGYPVGRVLDDDRLPLPLDPRDTPRPGRGGGTGPDGRGSIIVVLATDAALVPHQCTRLAQRATIGLARAGGCGDDSSGDLFLAFSTGNSGLRPAPPEPGERVEPVTIGFLPNAALTPLFHAAAEAVEEAILNALLAAVTTTGRGGRTAWALTPEALLAALAETGWRPST